MQKHTLLLRARYGALLLATVALAGVPGPARADTTISLGGNVNLQVSDSPRPQTFFGDTEAPTVEMPGAAPDAEQSEVVMTSVESLAQPQLQAHPPVVETTPVALTPFQGKPAAYHLSKPVEALETPPLRARIDNPAEGGNLSPEDAENLKTLWKAVLDRNPVIQFSLKQLSTPPELRYAHNAALSRSLGALLTGASFLPYAMGANAYAASASNVGANLVDRAVQKTQRVDPALLPSDTDLVTLSDLVQSLQRRLVSHYFEYKNALVLSWQRDQQARAILARDGQTDPRTLEALLLNDTTRQLQAESQSALDVAHLHYLALERLAGAKGLADLHFDTVAVNNPAPAQVSSREVTRHVK